MGNCSVGRDLALCEILALGCWPGYFGCRGGVLLDEVSPVRGADQGNRSPRSGQRFGPVGVGYISGGDGETV